MLDEPTGVDADASVPLDPDLCDGPPDLGPLRALAERSELTEAVSSLADAFGHPLAASDPLVPLARDIARALVEAGFTLHHCVRHHPLYQLGGVCLLPVGNQCGGDNESGVVASWTTHDLLALDWDRWATYHHAHEVMNDALAEVLQVLGFTVQPFGSGGASLVTGHSASDPAV